MIPINTERLRIEKLVELKRVPEEYKTDIEFLLKLLPASDQLNFYVMQLAEDGPDQDWFDFGVALIRDKKIIVTAKLETYHDCGVF